MRYERMPVETYARACRDVRVCPKEFKDKSAEMYGYVCRNVLLSFCPFVLFGFPTYGIIFLFYFKKKERK